MLIALDSQDDLGWQALMLIGAGCGAVGDRVDHSLDPLLRRQQAGLIQWLRLPIRCWALVVASLPPHLAPPPSL
ncbi:hypothetical protein ACWGQ4_00715 [Streptomyces sp. NPDC055721]|uniref:hypothetical protein n=1 Tax=Streptomyces sp. NPDC127132 TaxID=3345374 RepID=UPI003626816C